MYPFIRMIWQFWRHRDDAALPVTGTHVSRHIVLPWDLDFWNELNNGRTLTLYDMGRMPLSQRAGIIPALRREGWGMVVAGVSVRYRRRVQGFARITMKSRAVCWDERFVYTEQAMFRADGEATSHAMVRLAVTDRKKGGTVAPARLMESMGLDPVSPPMPGWIADWVRAENERPWPPMADDAAQAMAAE
ncbi:acyl-CoA thioesterase [Limimaricola pyoseonensis]|uniref:Acyl-CoA thioesterase FadM n=1 Tax=Limimaricola pyoseonensis TaxID=521013 RepID=A0A1G7ECW1_9RHOB|nr:acyl-CoA thioesterase [Limimaricola pyoseonensis]SDE61498.1 Acyl-CoA thioesterase FadM [Limimaricola pyoseonensis]